MTLLFGLVYAVVKGLAMVLAGKSKNKIRISVIIASLGGGVESTHGAKADSTDI